MQQYIAIRYTTKLSKSKKSYYVKIYNNSYYFHINNSLWR